MPGLTCVKEAASITPRSKYPLNKQTSSKERAAITPAAYHNLLACEGSPWFL